MKLLDQEKQKFQAKNHEMDVLREQFENEMDTKQKMFEKNFVKQLEKQLEKQFSLVQHRDQKDKEEIVTLKAQLTKLQLDDQVKTHRLKASNELLRQRLEQMEQKNHELKQELSILEPLMHRWIQNMMCREIEAQGDARCPPVSIPIELPVPRGRPGDTCGFFFHPKCQEDTTCKLHSSLH